MKLQLQDDFLRVRIDEAELALLLAGGTVSLRVGAPSVFALDIELASGLQLDRDETWRLCLPAETVRAYGQTLPRRDALRFDLVRSEASVLAIDFEVDVRDSLQVRGPRRREQMETSPPRA